VRPATDHNHHKRHCSATLTTASKRRLSSSAMALCLATFDGALEFLACTKTTSAKARASHVRHSYASVPGAL